MYLSGPLSLVRYLGIDTNFVVRKIPYLAHLPFVIILDIYVWRVFNRILEKNAARLGFALYFLNRFQTALMIRTFTNSLEATFTMVAFYYFLDQKG